MKISASAVKGAENKTYREVGNFDRTESKDMILEENMTTLGFSSMSKSADWTYSQPMDMASSVWSLRLWPITLTAKKTAPAILRE